MPLKSTVPLAFTLAWHKAHGQSDLLKTISEVHDAIEAIEKMWDIHLVDRLPGELSKRISNPKFLSSDLGKYVQIACLVGHEIFPKNFLARSGAEWDGESLLEIKEISEYQGEEGCPLVRLRAFYLGTELYVTKQVDEIIRMVYLQP